MQRRVRGHLVQAALEPRTLLTAVNWLEQQLCLVPIGRAMMDVPKEVLIEVRNLLRELVAEVEQHNSDYKHRTDNDLLEKARDYEKALTSQLESN